MTVKTTSSNPNADVRAKALILAIGNDSRNDDGLGWAAADKLAHFHPAVQVEMCYQLQVEDAELIQSYPLVIFIDASKDKYIRGFQWEQTPYVDNIYTMNTHALKPTEVLALCNQVYGQRPLAYTLAISGYKWNLKTGLTNKAKRNLDDAITFLMQWINQALK